MITNNDVLCFLCKVDGHRSLSLFNKNSMASVGLLMVTFLYSLYFILYNTEVVFYDSWLVGTVIFLSVQTPWTYYIFTLGTVRWKAVQYVSLQSLSGGVYCYVYIFDFCLRVHLLILSISRYQGTLYIFDCSVNGVIHMCLYVFSPVQVCVYSNGGLGPAVDGLPLPEHQSVCGEFPEDGAEAAGVRQTQPADPGNQLSESPGSSYHYFFMILQQWNNQTKVQTRKCCYYCQRILFL